MSKSGARRGYARRKETRPPVAAATAPSACHKDGSGLGLSELFYLAVATVIVIASLLGRRPRRPKKALRP